MNDTCLIDLFLTCRCSQGGNPQYCLTLAFNELLNQSVWDFFCNLLYFLSTVSRMQIYGGQLSGGRGGGGGQCSKLVSFRNLSLG